MTRRPTTTAAMKLKVLERFSAEVWCGICCSKCYVEDVEYDHIHPLALGGEHKASNLQPLCPTCHGIKTRGKGATTHGSDIGNIAKTKRLEKARQALEAGEKKKPKKTIPSRPFDKRLKKKFGTGEVVEREPRT